MPDLRKPSRVARTHISWGQFSVGSRFLVYFWAFFRATPLFGLLFIAVFSVGDRARNGLFHWVFWIRDPCFEPFLDGFDRTFGHTFSSLIPLYVISNRVFAVLGITGFPLDLGAIFIPHDRGCVHFVPRMLAACLQYDGQCKRCYSGHKDRKPNHIAVIVPTTNARLESGRRIGDWRKGLIVSTTGMMAKPTGTAAIAR